MFLAEFRVMIHWHLPCPTSRVAGRRKQSPAAQTSLPVAPLNLSKRTAPLTWDIELEENKSRSKKSRRAARRQAVAAPEGEMGLLRSASVSKVTKERYEKMFGALEDFARRGRLEMASREDVDAVASLFLENKYLEGEDMSMGSYAVAAITHFRPDLKGPHGLPRTQQALKGWRKLCPPRSRMPLPFEVVALLATHAYKKKLVEVALVLLLNFFLYLRPTEYRGLRVGDVVKPLKRGRGAYKWWSFLLHPTELGVPSKTEQWDESLTLDLAYQQFLGPAIYVMMNLKKRPKEEWVFSVLPQDLTQFMEQSWQELNLSPLGEPHLYRLRHGGASHEAGSHLRTIGEVQVRGRWQTMKSVKNYEKGGRITQLFAALAEDSSKTEAFKPPKT